MTEKDINIENEDTQKEDPVEETDKKADESEMAEETVNSEDTEEDPLEKAQKEIEELKKKG